MEQELIRGNVKVAWVELGEGRDGDYDEDDPADTELLRFDVYVRGPLITLHEVESEMVDEEWASLPHTCYCTRFPVETSPEQQQAGLLYIMDRLEAEVASGSYVKRLCAELSWIDPTWITKSTSNLQGAK